MTQKLLGKVLGSSYDADGFLGVQIEVFGKKSVGWFELSTPHGSVSRPLDPDDAGFCQAYYWYEGTRGYAQLANDTRTAANLPQIEKGETIVHHPLGTGFVRMHADGGMSLFTTHDNTPNGRSVFLTIDRTGQVFNFPYGRLTFNDTGFHLLHNSGARIDLGAVGGLPAPLSDAVKSYLILSADSVKVEGSAIKIGPRGVPSQPLALATQTLAALSALQGVITALASPGGIIAPPSGGPCTFGAAVATALANAASVLAASATTLPSVSAAGV
jgi:hypothetical protein